MWPFFPSGPRARSVKIREMASRLNPSSPKPIGPLWNCQVAFIVGEESIQVESFHDRCVTFIYFLFLRGKRCEDFLIEHDVCAPQRDRTEFSGVTKFSRTIGDDRLRYGSERGFSNRIFGSELEIPYRYFADAMEINVADADPEGRNQHSEGSIDDPGSIEIQNGRENCDKQKNPCDHYGRKTEETKQPT